MRKCCCKKNLARPNSFLTQNTGSFVVPNGVYSLKMWVISGGGGANPGYSAGGANGSGSGGGAGGTAYRQMAVNAGDVINYTIGGNAAPGTNGSQTTLTYGAFNLVANGGGRGFNNGGGGAGGTASGGSANISGGNGGNGNGGNNGGASGGSINGVSGLPGGGTCGGAGTQAADFNGMRSALALVVPAVTILGTAVAGCFGNPQVNGANGPSFGSSGSGSSAGPNSAGGSGGIGAGGGGSAANNSIANTGGFGQRGAVLFSW